ncbi:MAG: hypothetical protein K0B10_07180 [Vicingaceae bacterium]|nr:hypothetical protein [Vicingaceae bacterium]
MKTLKYLFTAALLASFFISDTFGEVSIAMAGVIGFPYADPNAMDHYASENFSSFEGDDVYTGDGDHFLNFGGPGISFKNEGNASRSFVMNITNNDKISHTATLTPGYDWVPGQTDPIKKYAADGAMLLDGASVLLSGSGSPKTIREFLSFLSKNPSNLAGIRVSSNNNTSQIEQTIIVRELSPFKDLESRTIILGNYTHENNQREKMVTVPTPGVILGPETELILPIMPQSVCTITFFIGGVLSTSGALKHKRAAAVAQLPAAQVAIPSVRVPFKFPVKKATGTYMPTLATQKN